ncbi:MAG TPA: NlpC/P60 family protein [Lachnospiraceae bacterium]
MKKRLLGLGLVLVLTAGQLLSVNASKEDLKKQRAATAGKLSEATKKISNIQGQLNILSKEIDTVNTDLVNVMVQIEVLKSDIEKKQEELAQTQRDLEVAIANKDRQYADMKKRIAYLYENGGNAAWMSMMLSADNLSDLLNKAEYTQQLYDYDRKSLEAFIATVQEVEDLQNRLESEKAELEEMEKSLEGQQASLESLLAEKQASSLDYQGQLAVVESQASQYAQLLAAQNQQIQAIEMEEAKAAQAARRAQQERSVAEGQRGENRQRGEQAERLRESMGTSTERRSSSTSGGVRRNSGNGGETSQGGSSKASGVGASAASYATNFVGNPYVWGGSSLTNGADCSGFVSSVYGKYGYSLPHSSAELASVGKSVSYSEAQAGDIICYSGHVAIYLGDGKIVHASNAKDGIKVSDNAAYRTIVSVRRLG